LVTMKDLLESGAHFGHKVSRWNPKMKKFIFAEKNGIYIIDLQKTVKMLEKAYNEIVEKVSNSKKILFVGTKRQSRDIIKDEAMRCGSFYICERWLGGMLTNFRTIRRTINRLIDYDKKKESGFLDTLPKKEALSITRKMEKMEKILGGVKTMNSLPDLLYIVDIKREYIAAHEANILGIPVIAIVDTNTDPDLIHIPIPANDDAIRSIKLVTSIISQAVFDGKQLVEAKKVSIEEQEEEKVKSKQEAKKKQLKKKPIKSETARMGTEKKLIKKTTTKQKETRKKTVTTVKPIETKTVRKKIEKKETKQTKKKKIKSK